MTAHPGGDPNCDTWCKGGPGAPGSLHGHRAVPPQDAQRIADALKAIGIDPATAPEEDLKAAVAPLYRAGSWGYHAIADAMGKSHEWAFLVLTGQA